MTIEKLADSKAVIAFLNEKFPKCFTLEGEAKPLKIGIFQDLAERLAEEECVSKTQLRQALRHYTNSWRYLGSVKVSIKRVDLDGTDGDEVEQQHADHAQKELQESKAKFAEMKAQKAKKDPKKATSNRAAAARKYPKAKPSGSSDTNRNKIEQKKDRLSPVNESMLKVGAKVSIKLGRVPVNAVITEIEKSDIYVQLDSGMVVKTSSDKLFS